MTREYLVVTAVGRDKPGTVETLTDIAVAGRANIEESRMARLGGEFAVIMLLSHPSEAARELIENFNGLHKKGITVTTHATDLARLNSLQGYVPYEMSVFGADHEGIVNQVARYLASQQINVESMETHVTNAPNTGAPLFSMHAQIQAPPEISLKKLRQSLLELGDEMDVDIDIWVPAV
jgi:glycine cleavage system transcriptional repressor